MLPSGPVSSYLTFSPLPSTTLRRTGGNFLLHYYTLTDIFPLGSMVLCVARTFLGANEAPRWNSLLQCKGKKLQVIGYTLIILVIFAIEKIGMPKV